MDIFIYSDESGTFDVVHEKFFVYAGVCFLSKEDRDNSSIKYASIERAIKHDFGTSKKELKAAGLSPKTKRRIISSLGGYIKFAVIINLSQLNGKIFKNSKHKQRYLDYAFKVELKYLFKDLSKEGKINPNKVHNIFVYADEHNTATDGRYELEEALYNEFKIGTFNFDYDAFFTPIFPHTKEVKVKFCDSKRMTLIRVADMVANYVLYLRRNGQDKIVTKENLYLYYLPGIKTIY